MIALSLCAALALSLPVSAARPGPSAKLEWQPRYELALERATAEGRVVFVAVDFSAEGRSERVLKLLAKDKRLLELTAETLNVPASFKVHKKSGRCPRFKGVECSDHRNNEAVMRGNVLLENDVSVIATPQYLWLDGEGRVLLSVPYELGREELVWCFERARQLADPEGAPALSEEARPPRRLLMGRAYRLPAGSSPGRGMTGDELEKVIAESKKSLFGMTGRRTALHVLFTDEPEAVEYIKVELSGMLRMMAGGLLPETLHALGDLSPTIFWEVLEDFQKHKNAAIRHEVAVALEQLGASDALRLARGALKREKNERVERAWLRAVAACGPTDKGVRKLLLKTLEKDGPGELRASAAFALGYLQRGEDIRARWHELLAAPDPRLAVAAACGAALARDAACIPSVEAAVERFEGEDRSALERALAVLRGGDLHPLEDDVARVTGDDLRRARIFFGAPPAPATPGKQ